MKNYSKSHEKSHESQFGTNSSDATQKSLRNLSRPEKDMLVLGELYSGAKKFDSIQKATNLERNELISILEDLEKRGLMRVEQKSGLFGPKVELYVTDKGFKEYYS